MTIDAGDNITLTLPGSVENVRTVTSDTVKSVRSVKSVRMDTFE